MGRMKDIFIEKMNEDRDRLDDIDWEYQNAQPKPEPEPEPIQIAADGKKLYLIKSAKDGVEYKIWAHSYKQALELLPMIESF